MKWVNVIELVVLLWNYVLCKLYICCLMSFFFVRVLFSYQNLFKKHYFTGDLLDIG